MDRIAYTFLTAIGFGPYLVDSVPLLELLPDFLSPWRVMSKKLYADTLKLYGGLAQDVKKRMEDGTAEECFVKELWDNQRNSKLDDEVSGISSSVAARFLMLSAGHWLPRWRHVRSRHRHDSKRDTCFHHGGEHAPRGCRERPA